MTNEIELRYFLMNEGLRRRLSLAKELLTSANAFRPLLARIDQILDLPSATEAKVHDIEGIAERAGDFFMHSRSDG